MITGLKRIVIEGEQLENLLRIFLKTGMRQQDRLQTQIEKSSLSERKQKEMTFKGRLKLMRELELPLKKERLSAKRERQKKKLKLTSLKLKIERIILSFHILM